MPKTAARFHSAYAHHAAPSPADVLAFHRAVFGDARMVEDPSAGGDNPPASPPPSGGEPGQVGPNGYPEATPVKDMSAEHQAAYWKHHSRQWENKAKDRDDYDTIKSELDTLRAASLTEAEKALDEARTTARSEGEKAATDKYAAALVKAEIKAALAAKQYPADQIGGHVEYLDAPKFLTANGEVDADKVQQYVDSIAPKQWPDMGGGRRGGTHTPAKGVAAGADLFAASRTKKPTT